MPDISSLPLGLVTGLEGSSTYVKIIVAVFLSIALYNVIEITTLIFLTFRRYSGLYFWSILISTAIGVNFTSIGSVLHFFNAGPLSLALILSNIGFIAMVPGQSLILYSRLHLVFYRERCLRYILWLIIVNSTILVVLTIVTTFGSAFIQQPVWNRAYQVTERLQVTGFCVQELLLSSLYIWETTKLIRLCPGEQDRRKMIMYELISINVVIIMLDITLLVTEYLNFYYIQVPLKSMVYSIKLKLELAVLGRMVALTNIHHDEIQSEGQAKHSEFSDPAHRLSDFTHATSTTEGSSSQRQTNSDTGFGYS